MNIPRLTRAELRRVEAVHAAATAFASGLYETQAELWSLAVFFERFIETGAEGTLTDFGPVEYDEDPAAINGSAKILRLVPRP